MNKKSELWQRIKAARQRAGLRQLDVAAHFEISRTAITQWEAREVSKRTRPDISRLREFAKLTRTPLWWLLDDNADPQLPWPEVSAEGAVQETPPGDSNNLREYLSEFWTLARQRVREQRPDLWPRIVWEPATPDWLAPLRPDAATERCVIEFIHTTQRPLFPRVASAMAMLNAYAESQDEPRTGRGPKPKGHADQTFRCAVLIWYPDELPKGLELQAERYREDVRDIDDRAHALADRLGVRYIKVRNTDEAAAYLIQLL